MVLFGLTYVEWGLGGAILLYLLYKLGTWNYDYFTSRGIKNPKLFPFLGSMGKTVFGKKAFAYHLQDICTEFNDQPFIGFFQFLDPHILVMDPELIKRITVKDFEYFMDHRQIITENADPLFAKNLFSLRGEKWRDMRTTLSPAFTSRKIKNMFHLMNQCGKQLVDYLQEEINKQEPGQSYTLEMKDLFTRFANDVIATSAFGIQVDSLKDKNNIFYSMGKSVTDFSGFRGLLFLGFMLFPKLMELLGVGFLSNKQKLFFTDLVHQTVTTREKEGIVRPDMIHLLMQARKGQLDADKDEVDEFSNGIPSSKKVELTESDIAAQAMIFFIAGFDTTSTLLSFLTLLLAMNEDVQRKLQEEVDGILADDPNLTYEKVQKMNYLDMVISETLRMYPPTLMMDRLCVKNYRIPATDKTPEFTVRKGDSVIIPVYVIHRDPKYYPHPERFDPERFNDENKLNIQPYTYLPFGVGPRLCIGQRFALLEAKVAIVHLLSRFNLAASEKTLVPIRLAKKDSIMAPEGGSWLVATPRQQVET